MREGSAAARPARQGRLEAVTKVLTAWSGRSGMVINTNDYANAYLELSLMTGDDRPTSTPVLISGNYSPGLPPIAVVRRT